LGGAPTNLSTPQNSTIKPPFQAPADLRDFTGYTAEAEQVIAAFEQNLEKGFICGVWGMGGVGKTSFATHIAHQLKKYFADGILWVEMYGMREHPTSVEHAMRYVIYSFYPGETIPEDIDLLAGRYRSVLEGKRVLIILDDAFDPEQIEPLIPPSPSSLLVTSRAQIALDGLVPFKLDGFDESTAPRFVKKLSGHNHLTDEQSQTISKLCGYLPLALRVAGTYLLVYSDNPNSYIRELQNEMTKLVGLHVQKRNVEAILSLSARRLIQEDESLANLWQSLSVCQGNFELYTAENIIDPANAGLYSTIRTLIESRSNSISNRRIQNDQSEKLRKRIEPLIQEELKRLDKLPRDPESINELLIKSFKIQKQLNALAERSLIYKIKSTEEPYYRIHELMRPIARRVFNYGGSEIQKKEQKSRLYTSAKRHAKWLTEMVAFSQNTFDDLMYEATGFVGSKLLLETYWNDFLAGQSWAVSHLETDDEAANICACYATCAAYTLDNLMPPSQRIQWLEYGLRAVQKLGGDGIESASAMLNNLGNMHRIRGNSDDALIYYQRAVNSAQEHNNRSSEAIAQGNIGIIYFNRGEFDEALSYYQKRLDISREINSESGIADSLINIGYLYLSLDKPQNAISKFEEALEVSQKAHYWRGENYALAGISDFYLNQNNIEKDKEYSEKCLELTKKLGNKSGQAHALIHLSKVKIKEEKHDEAVSLASEALKLARVSEYRLREIQCLYQLGEAYAFRHDHKAKPVKVEERDQGLIIIRFSVSSREELEDDLSLSIAAFEEMFYLAKTFEPYKYLQHSYNQLMHILKLHGNLSYKRGELRKAKEYFNKCLTFSEEMDDLISQAKILKLISNISFEEKDFENLISIKEKVLELSIKVSTNEDDKEALLNLRQIYKELGEAALELNLIDNAIQFTKKQVEIARHLQMEDCESKGLIQLAGAYMKKNQYKEAAEYSKLGLDKAMSIENVDLQNSALNLLLEILRTCKGQVDAKWLL
jgi:tetratricopeptide (TPR) repeat protein